VLRSCALPRHGSGLVHPPFHRVTPYERDGVAVVRALLSPVELGVVREGCRRLRSRMKPEKDALAVGRVGCFIDRRSEIHAVLTSDAVAARISAAVGRPMAPSVHPVELRSYRRGAEMAWHRDDQLYTEPQCELVLCLENDSDSRTEWIDAQGVHLSEQTRPNTALLVRAGEDGVAHRVTPLRRGERTILKMIWAVPDSAPLPELFEHLDSLPGLRKRVRRGVTRGRQR